MIKRTLLVLAFSIILTPAIKTIAADWKLVAHSDENDVNTFVDNDSLVNNGDVYNFWMFHDFRGKSEYQGKKIEKTTAYAVINCNTNKINYKEIIVEWTDGKTQKSTPSLEDEVIKEGTVSEGVLNFVCHE